jgi:hypothetical protein
MRDRVVGEGMNSRTSLLVRNKQCRTVAAKGARTTIVRNVAICNPDSTALHTNGNVACAVAVDGVHKLRGAPDSVPQRCKQVIAN